MPIDYSKTKLLLFGSNGAKVNEPNTFLLPTTTGRAEFLADIKRKYRDYLNGKGKIQSYYEAINKIGVENLTAIIIKEQPCKDKVEMVNFVRALTLLINKPIEAVISENKSELKPITLTRYMDTINLLQRKLGETSNIFYNNSKPVLSYINNELKSNETKKNYLKALVALIPSNNPVRSIYQNELMRIGSIQQAVRDTNEKSQVQADNWKNYSEVVDKYTNLYKLNMKNNLITPELIVGSFYSGLLFAPWRVKELLFLKWRNYDPKTENYIDFKNGVIVLHIYKTEKDYGECKQKIPKAFIKVLLQYTTKLKGDWLIENQNGGQTNYYELNKIIKTVYGVSASLLRNIYITNLWDTGKLKTNAQIKAVAHEMRNSPEQTLEYRKFNSSITEDD